MNRSRFTKNARTVLMETKDKNVSDVKKTAPLKWLHRTSLTTAEIIYNRVFKVSLEENRKAV